MTRTRLTPLALASLALAALACDGRVAADPIPKEEAAGRPAARLPYQDGRLVERFRVAMGAGVEHREHAGWRDTQMGVECAPQLAADGAWRCLPRPRLGTLVFFEDEQCTQPLGAFDSARESCEPGLSPSNVAVHVPPGDACAGARVYTLDEAVPARATWQLTIGGCLPSQVPAAFEVHRAREVPPSRFVEMTVGIE